MNVFCLSVSLVSFSNILFFSVCKFFTSLVKFIHKHFILLDASINGIILLICFLACSFLVYRNATKFCMLVLCLETLLNLFISFSGFFVESLGFSIYIITSSVYGDKFISSFPIWMPFIFFRKPVLKLN